MRYNYMNLLFFYEGGCPRNYVPASAKLRVQRPRNYVPLVKV